MEFLQCRERKQLARQRCANNFLDGQALAVTYCQWILDRRCCRLSIMVSVVNLGYARIWWTRKNGTLATSERKGTIRIG